MWPLGILKKTVDISKTLLLIPFSSSFADSSIYNRSVTVDAGSPVVNSNVTLFGLPTLELNGSSSLQVQDAADFELGSDDFTIEFFLYLPVINGSNMGILSKRSDPFTNRAFYIYIDAQQRIQLSISYDGTTNNVSGATNINAVPIASWRHFAIERYQGLLKVYVAGVSDASIVMTGSVFDSPAKTIIGALNASAGLGLNGRLANLRIRRGAVYKGNFTPPTAPFTY